MNNRLDEKRYRVRVGHIEVVVDASDDEQAIAAARRELAKDLPRLYDLIRSMEVSRFEVKPAA